MSDLLKSLEAQAPVDQLVTIDFETYYDSDYQLRKMTTIDYVRDARFEVIGVGVKLNGGHAQWMTPEAFAAWALTVDWSRTAVLAHNTAFDGFILAYHYDVYPALWCDTLSMARGLHGLDAGGSLEKLMPKYGVGEKGHEVHDAIGKRRADFTPEEYAAYGRYCCNDTDGCYAIFQKMREAGFPEQEIWLIDTTIRMLTEPSFMTDEPLLIEGLAEERARKAALLERVGHDKKQFTSGDKFAALLAEFEVDPPMKPSPKAKNPDGTPKAIYAFAKSDPGMQDLLEHPIEEVRWLAETRIATKSNINETRTERFLKLGSGRRAVPVFLKYCAAHTGRWGGGEKTNFQNLERTNKKDPRKGRIRKALLAPEGEVLVVADSAQIEARGLGWLSGHTELTTAFAQKRDVYSEFASKAYGRHVDRKARAEDEIAGFVGKTCVLGLGYGMGWKKFAKTMLAGAMGGPPVQFTAVDAEPFTYEVREFMTSKYYKREVAGITSRLGAEALRLHCAVAKCFVERYRQENEPIVAFWAHMDEVLEAMLSDAPAMTFGPGGVIKVERHALLLPSGRRLKYPGLSRTQDDKERWQYSYMGGKGGKERVKAYGGYIAENVDQAISRDIVAEQMLHVRAEGLKIVTMTHDEIVARAPAAEGPAALKSMLARMHVPPAWAQGLPLSAEGGFHRSYGLAKS